MGVSVVGGAFYIQQQSANAMLSHPRIVVSMSSNDLYGQAGTYTDVQRGYRDRPMLVLPLPISANMNAHIIYR